MGPKSESSCQQDIKEVINRALVVAGKQPFCTKKCCIQGRGQVAQPVAGSTLNEVFRYLNPVNFETVEASKSYPLCANMRRKIRKELANRDKEKTNLTVAAAIPDPPNNNGDKERTNLTAVAAIPDRVVDNTNAASNLHAKATGVNGDKADEGRTND